MCIQRALIIPCLFVSLSLQATERFGYWWYEEPSPTSLDDTQFALPPLPSQTELMTYHPKQLEKILEERLDYAVWKGEPEAILNYYKVQDVARRKALMFTALTEYVMLKNPALNAKSQYHITNAGRKHETNIRKTQISQQFIAQKDDYALVVFTKPSCEYCPTQAATLAYFADRHGWTVKNINIEDNIESAARFNVTTTPMTILIQKASKDWMPIAVGLAPVTTIEDNTYRAIRLLSGDITPQEYITPEHQRGGFFDPTHVDF